jgi:hypothetical protein
MKLLKRKRTVGEIVLGLLSLWLSAMFFHDARLAGRNHGTFFIHYSGYHAAGSAAQGYVLATLFLLFGVALIIIFVCSGGRDDVP